MSTETMTSEKTDSLSRHEVVSSRPDSEMLNCLAAYIALLTGLGPCVAGAANLRVNHFVCDLVGISRRKTDASLDRATMRVARKLK
jgi:hypothetical protein